MKTSGKVVRRICLAIILGVMASVFVVALPYLQVDRASENSYMGTPYRSLASVGPRITDNDPYVENGPQAVFVSAGIAYATGSLKPMRYFHFLYSLIVMSLLFFFFFSEFEGAGAYPLSVIVCSILMLTVWISIPLSLIYPIQVNGMTPGFACFLIGLMLLRKRPCWAMIAFGAAYSYKGQFLAMLPGIVIYKFLVETRFTNFKDHLVHVILSVLLYFVPAVVVLPALGAALGLFNNSQDFWAYALRAPHILFSEISDGILRLMGKTQVDVMYVNLRKIEYARYRLIPWLQIGFSVVFCLFFSAKALWHRLNIYNGVKSRINEPLSLLAICGIFYWLNYLFFWRFPYWYNVLPMVLFNIALTPAFVDWLRARIGVRYGPARARSFLIFVGVVSVFSFGHFLIRTPGWHSPRVMGDSLTPYEWMRLPQT